MATGRPTDPPLDRRTGEGRVDATPGHYRDALAKRNIVHLLATESTGALSPPVILLLRTLAKAEFRGQSLYEPTKDHAHLVLGGGHPSKVNNTFGGGCLDPQPRLDMNQC